MSTDSLSLSIPTILPPPSSTSSTEPTTSDSTTTSGSAPPTQTETETTPTSAPPSTTPTSEPPTDTNTNTNTGTGTGNGSGTPTGSGGGNGSGSQTTPPSSTEQSTESTLTTPQTTVTQVTTIVTAPDGQTQTTVFETGTTLPPGSVVTSPASSNNNRSSDSNTGAIAGGVVGGVAALAILIALAVWGYKRWRLRKAIEEFDGNFDPDRVVSSGGAVGGMSQRPGGGGVLSRRDPPGAPTLPQIPIDDTEDDGMGGRLNATSIGGGVVSPYPLFAPGHHSPHPSQTTFPNPYGPPPQSPTTTDSHYTGAGAGGMTGDWRHPSPGPSLPTTAPSVHSSSHSGGVGAGVGMSPGRLAKEREAYGGFAGGMPIPQHQQHPNQPAPYGPSSYNYYPRTNAPSDTQSQSQYSQPSSSHQQQQQPPRLSVANPDMEEERRTYLAEGPLVHRDAGPARDEIPPTYDSLLPNVGGSGSGSGSAGRDVKGGAGQGVGEGSGSRD